MTSSVVLSDQELNRVRQHLDRFDWYAAILAGYRARVDELIERAPEIPVVKGRAFFESCPADHSRLIFDPYAPAVHECPRCGRDWRGEEFDLAWVRQFQDWLGKRLVEAGILYRVTADERYARLVRDSLDHFVRRYREYPLANNLLGPTRLFQSTYLEAFWLVDIVAAYDLTRAAPAYSTGDHSGVEDLLFESSELVRSFDEGVSNRQAFNNAGVGAVALLFDDEALLGHVLDGPHGFAFHMRESLLEDGIWYEGETYHFATLDHTLNLAEMARHKGIDLYHGGSAYPSLRPMFDGPLEVMLPDLTFPSRKDSWYGRGIGYHREIFELGYARYGDERYGGLLAHAYASGTDRSDLAWRSFLHLEPELPEVPVEELRPRSGSPMRGTGLAVLRGEEGRASLSLEYGHYGGGHGHPDRLHLSLFADGTHWLADPGTGWYHVKELGWYRSTLAHNSVMVGGANQDQAEGELTAFGSARGFSLAQGVVAGAYPGTSMRRTSLLAEGMALDIVTVERESDDGQPIDLTLNVRGKLTVEAVREPAPTALSPRGGHPFLQGTERLRPVEPGSLSATVEFEGRRLRILRTGAEEHYLGRGPGIPLREEVPFNTFVSRKEANSARFMTVCLWGEGEADATLGPDGELAVGEDSYRLIVDHRPGGALVQSRSGRPVRAAWFGRAGLRHGGLEVRCDFPLEAAALEWQGEVLSCDLPARFGLIRVTGVDLPSRVEGLPEGADWRVERGAVLLRQAEPLALWRAETGTARLAAGMTTQLLFQLARYDEAGQDPPVASMPEGWQSGTPALVESDDQLEWWRLDVAVPAGAAGEHSVEIRCRDASLTVPVRVASPLRVDVDLESRDGEPVLVLALSEAAGRPGRVWGEASAPWAFRAPHPFLVEIGAQQRELLSFPLPTHPVAATAIEPAGRSGAEVRLPAGDFEEGGDNTGRLAGDNAGEYGVSLLLERDGYRAAASFRFPLAWARRRNGEAGIPAVGGMRLDRPEQAYWAEDPWPGPAGASANGLLEWDDRGLYLRCRVLDDEHVAEANSEDLYENDSLQLYLDFRPAASRNSSFSPGVAAFIFAPDAGLERVRIEPIAGSRELANRGLAAPWFTTEGVTASVVALADGWELDVFMPYASLGIEPLTAGSVFRADLSLSDNDGNWYRTHQLVWSGARGYRRCYLRWAYLDPTGYGWVVVSDA